MFSDHESNGFATKWLKKRIFTKLAKYRPYFVFVTKMLRAVLAN